MNYFSQELGRLIFNPYTIKDYAYRLQKLYSFAYLTEGGKLIDIRLREIMLMDGFLGGLKSNLHELMTFKEFRTLNYLIKATESCAAILNEVKLDKKTIRFYQRGFHQ